MLKNKILIILRLLLGTIFIVSGIEKIISPYQNFLYVVQSYEVFPESLEMVVVRIVPWIELFVGLFIILGLWLVWALRGSLALLTGFLFVVSQALIRKLPITECGCFGELFSVPLYVVLMFDSSLFLLTFFLINKIQLASQFSLDRYFAE